MAHRLPVVASFRLLVLGAFALGLLLGAASAPSTFAAETGVEEIIQDDTGGGTTTGGTTTDAEVAKPYTLAECQAVADSYDVAKETFFATGDNNWFMITLNLKTTYTEKLYDRFGPIQNL